MGVWTNVTNFEDGDFTKIKVSMNYIHCQKSVADIISIPEACYVFTVFCSIFYNEPKPLKFTREKRQSDHVQVVRQENELQSPAYAGLCASRNKRPQENRSTHNEDHAPSVFGGIRPEYSSFQKECGF